ncbi:hypothetical protein Pla108_19240 [Botrimarina colliarenosi]|uniref:Type VI secretion protein, VC_A0111 family n=1 Tax=Botrimarina colliarenosi TaxID=2528001 RepID=A0A5C6ACJ9_9BACT|nr:type VI secretion system baseplate subunit TssG [Botrimarina colliarenosi]TWT97772.1 hypothetical protein Pla108_19240 [Botrimarina colliarenosi]
MTTKLSKPATPHAVKASVAEKLFTEPGKFDFYQAVGLLEKIADQQSPDSGAKGRAVRFRTPASTAFSTSEIESIEPAAPGRPAEMVVGFMGLTGPSGVLPRHYTEQLVQMERRLRGAARRTLHAWYDLFSNRYIGQLFRAKAGRRIDRGVATGESSDAEPDRFTTALQSLGGTGMPALGGRLLVRDASDEWLLDRIPDAALARHAGVLARRQRPASQIAATLSDYFQAPVRIESFRGQWLKLEPADQTRLGGAGQANQLGVDAVLGSQVWDRQSRVRVVVGPLDRHRFEQFLPDPTPGKQRRRFQLLCQLTRLLLGPELDYDVQLILKRPEVPRLQATTSGPARLGWDAWLGSRASDRDGDEPIFEPIEATTLS